jgi:hypothetical protein
VLRYRNTAASADVGEPGSANADAGANRIAGTDIRRDGDTHTHADANANANAERSAYRHTDADLIADPGSGKDDVTHGNACGDTRCDLHAHRHTQSVADGHLSRHRQCDVVSE